MAVRRPAKERFHSLVTTSLTVLSVLAVTLLLPGPVQPAAGSPASAPARLSLSWPTGTASVEGYKSVVVRAVVSPGDAPTARLSLSVTNARFITIPAGCRASDVLQRHSWISPGQTQLTCAIDPLRTAGATINIGLRVANVPGSRVYVRGRLDDGPTVYPPNGKVITKGTPRPSRSFRLLSSPDFLNADVADLAHPSSGADWDPSRSENSINDKQALALNTILSDWSAQRPDAVMVAGDLVNGHWGKDTDNTGNFGPVGTLAEKRAAVQRAAITYYPQWKQRLRDHGLLRVYPAMGDHEYGDDPWIVDWKRQLASTFRAQWAKQFTINPDGAPRFRDRPVGSKHEFSAYAWRPHPMVQAVTLDVFDNLSAEMRIRLDAEQMTWLRGVLAKAKADGVPWIIVQGHTPIVGPVRQSSSSGLMFEGGASSTLWEVFKKYGVDVYLTGEVHAVTEVRRDGIVQISHGGLFSFAHSNYLLADVYSDRLEISVRDFDGRWSNSEGRLWETQTPGGPKDLVYQPNPPIIGTTTLWKDGRENGRSGALLPYSP